MPTHASKTILLATDLQNSVLNAVDGTRVHGIAYTPYGHRPLNGLFSLLGFNGELMDPLTGQYHLGKGYRQFNLLLMRFNSPDNLSPFDQGGLNAYAYCAGDPVNHMDSSGHFKVSNLIKNMSKTAKTHHSGKKAISNFIEPAIRKTVADLGGKEKIKMLAKEANMPPEAYVLEQTMKGQLKHTAKILQHPPATPRSIESMKKIIPELEKTYDIFFDILVGTKVGEFRPNNIKEIYRSHETMLGGVRWDLKHAEVNFDIRRT